MFVKRSIERLFRTALTCKHRFCVADATKILRESDSLSQTDIDLILGNDPEEN